MKLFTKFCCLLPLLRAVEVIYFYDYILTTLAIIGCALIIGFEGYKDLIFRILHILLVLFPRLVFETVFMAQNYNELWAKLTFVLRSVTLALFSIMLITEIVILATIEDEDFDFEDSLPIVTIVGVILICIDIYFTLMYYQYWKHPELRENRTDKGPEVEI